MNESTTLKFRDLLRAVLDDKNLSQHDLAFHANVSQTAISLVGSHDRKLSEKLATGIAKVLGGDKAFWLEAYGDFESGKMRALDFYVDQIGGGYSKGQMLGTGARRLLNFEMIELFHTYETRKDCRIQGFDPRRVRPSSYYTRLGYVLGQDANASRPIRDPFTIAPHATLKVRTLEVFHLPLWLEAQFHPASTMAEHGLTVEHGPSIDPGFEGRLEVTLRNVTGEEVRWDPQLAFLKLRFWIFDRAAKTKEELAIEYGYGAITDEDVFQSATADVA